MRLEDVEKAYAESGAEPWTAEGSCQARDPMHAQVDHWFTHHPPDGHDVAKYTELRDTAKTLAHRIVTLCPASADRTTAIRKLREAVMTANAAIACKGR